MVNGGCEMGEVRGYNDITRREKVKTLEEFSAAPNSRLYPQESRCGYRPTLQQFSSAPKQQNELLSQQGYAKASVSGCKGTTKK